MKRYVWLAAAGCVAMSVSLWAQDAKAVLQNAQKAIGDVKSVQFSGTGMNAFFGQALTAGKPWPRRDLTGVAGAMNFEQKSAKVELVLGAGVWRATPER